MLNILDPEYMNEVREFAKSMNLEEQLDKKLDYLSNYGNGDGDNTCNLGRDFAPHSFSFVMLLPDGSYWFNGGLIYQGPYAPADGSFPSLTVSLAIGTGWFVHT